MKKYLAITLLIVAPGFSLCQGQASRFFPLDELGWEMVDFSTPPSLTESDIGEVNYLVTINKNGEVKKIKVLSTTFSKKAERIWRDKILASGFKHDKAQLGSTVLKGTLYISRQLCNPDKSVPDPKLNQ